ncbi:MAG: 50S ribosomal protein L6 [Candidatus Saganbacteria bacterium]|nr:50S ribosomal protein L6 [Candidatus Saganbacteria bacterium]
MSRIGRLPIALPQGVEVKIEGTTLTIKGPKGTMQKEIPYNIEVIKEEKSLVVKNKGTSRRDKCFHGLFRSLAANMVTGVSKGFERVLELSGVGYRAAKAGSKLSIQIGFSHPVEIEPPKGVNFDVEGQVRIKVSGVDKELVGLIASQIKEIRPVEPYKGKGILYQGEKVRRKAGKAAAKAGGAG